MEGDHQAWQQLVRQYAAMVYTVACRAGLTPLDAEDCAQHTWLSLYRKRRSIKDPIAVPVWLIRTVHREAIKTARNLGRSTSADNMDEPVDGRSLPDDQLESLQLQLALSKAIERLDPRCRRLITEMYLSKSEKKYRELAAEIGVKPNSFGPLRKRCLIKLREILKKMGYPMD